MAVGCLAKQNWKEEQRQLKATCRPGSEHRLVAKRGALHTAACSGWKERQSDTEPRAMQTLCNVQDYRHDFLEPETNTVSGPFRQSLWQCLG